MKYPKFDEFRLKAIELCYGDCPEGTIGHSLVTLAKEVRELRTGREGHEYPQEKDQKRV